MLKHASQSLLLLATVLGCHIATADSYHTQWYTQGEIELGPRPHFVVSDMDDSDLKEKLRVCEHQPSRRSTFSIGHRGAALQFPEHTKESYEAAARMGAGIIECDVTFTKDEELVCRHSQCDLHTTTNILATPLAEKCSVPFTPADPATGTPAQAMCCTSDLTVAEFKSLKGKMDAYNPNATTVEEYMNATADYRTDLYATRGTLMTHQESIELFKSLGAKMTPELKTPSVDMPFNGDYTQEAFAQQMIDEYKAAGVKPADVFAQSFLYDDILYWLDKEPEFARQAVFLDGRYDLSEFDFRRPETWEPSMEQLATDGVRYLAPPMWMLLDTENGETLQPSLYANSAKAAGINLITWTLERSGPLATGGGWYYQSVNDAINNDGDMLVALDVMAQQVGIKGIFSDWPATVTYYANCMGLE